MYCPFGIDIAYLLLVVRRICSLLGVVPLYLQDTTNSHSATMNQMWVHQDEWIDTLQWQEEEAQAELPTLRMPLEKEGADLMYSVIAPEPKFQAQLIYQAAVIMDVAGVDWTMPATPGWDNSDMAMYTGDNEIMCHNSGAGFELFQLWYKLPVHIRQKVEGNHTCLAKVECKDVLLFNGYQMFNAVLFCIFQRFFYSCRIKVVSYSFAAVFPGCSNWNTTISTSQIINQIIFCDICEH